MRASFSDHNPYKELSRLSAFMGNATCQSILKVLAAQNNCIINRLISIPGLSSYTIMTNLRLLKKTGLIKGSLKAHDLHYCLDYARLEELKATFDEFYSVLMQNKQKVNPTNKLCTSNT